MECPVLRPLGFLKQAQPLPIGEAEAARPPKSCQPKSPSLASSASLTSPKPGCDVLKSCCSGDFGRGSTAELASLAVAQACASPQSGPRADMSFSRPFSGASICSPLSNQLGSSGRGSVAELTSLVVAEMPPPTAAQQLRERSVAGSVVVFVAPGYEGKRFVFEIARRMELRVVIIDEADSWCRGLQREGVIEKFLPLELEHLDASFEKCAAAIAGVKEELGRLDAVVSFCELSQSLVARLNAHFNLPGNSLASIEAARDKYRSREAFQRAGLPSPKFFLIADPDQCPAAAAHVGFPAVIKPTCGVASIGVVRVDDAADLARRVEEARRELLGARVISGALQQGLNHEELGREASSWIDLSIMMEEYLDGAEVDVDVAVAEGKVYYEAITDNWPTVEPYFNETGSNCPSLLPAVQQAEILDLTRASLKALGLTMGVFHVEAKYTSQGARLLEVNCRMGGGAVYLINKFVHGIDLVVEQLLLSCGGAPLAMVDRPPLCNVAEYSINCPRSGYIAHTQFLDPWEGHPQLVYARPLVHPFQRVVGPKDGMPTWLCEVMCTAPSVEAGIQLVRDIENQLEFPIVDDLPLEGLMANSP